MEKEEHEDELKPTKSKELTKKQELNNHIVSMRKRSQQARVHTINKLAKEIKRLKQRKGQESAVEKSQRKAERLVEEITILKHLGKDEISIFALQDKLALVDHLQNLETPIKARALARIGHHPVVQSAVKEYRDKYPHWALQIPVLLEKSKEKQKLATKKLEKKDKLKAQRIKSSDPANPEEVDPIPVESKSSKKVKASLPPVPVDKVEGTLTVRVLTDLTELEFQPEQKAKKNKSGTVPSISEGQPPISDEQEAVPPKRPRSSFFLGGVDEPITTPKENREAPQKLRPPKGQFSEAKPIFRKGKLVSKPPRIERRAQFKADRDRGGDSSWKSYDNSQNKSSAATTSFSGSRSTPKSTPTPPAEKLHPSWEAKKREAKALTAFQGKKKVFNDDD